MEDIENKKEQEDIDPMDTIHEDAIDILLREFEPVDTLRESDTRFTTAEIIRAIELHYHVPQGSTDYFTRDAGLKVVQKLQKLGFRYVNTGGLKLEWIMRKR